MSSNHNDTSTIPLLSTSTPFLNLNNIPTAQQHAGLTVSQWAGNAAIKTKIKQQQVNEKENNWKDVYRNIKCMDQLYDASFYSWLKSEENVLVTAMYLHRIANEYPLVRIINALKWLISDWRLESISTLVRHVTVDWCDEAGDLRRAHLLRHLTTSWATQYTTTLITMVLSSAPYTTTTSTVQRERFLRAFTKDWDFSKLSEFFMYLQSPANIDYKVKCVMLQEAARRERETLGAKLLKKKRNDPEVVAEIIIEDAASSSNSNNSSSNSASSSSSSTTTRRHHRRTSSNDVNDIKRLRLSTPDPSSSNTNTNVETVVVDNNNPSTSRRANSNNQPSIPSNELSHLHLNTGSSSDHPRRRSSSITSEEDTMDTKKRGGPSAISTHFHGTDGSF